MNIKKFLLSAVAFVAATAAFADGQLSVPAYTAEELQDNVAMYLKLGKKFMKRDFTLAETPSEPIRVNLDGKEFVKYHDTDESQKDFYLRDRYIAKATIEFSSYVYGYTTDPSAGVGEASYESFVNGGEAYFIAKKNAKAIAYQFSFLTGKDIPVYLLNEDGKATFADYGHNDSYNVTFITLAQKNYVDAINAANEAIKDIPASFQAVDKTNWDKMVAAAGKTDEKWADNQAALEAALAAYKANYAIWKAAQDKLAANEIYNGTLDEMKVDGKPFPFKAGNYEKIGEKAAEKDIKDFKAWNDELNALVNHYGGSDSKMTTEYGLYTAEVDKVQAKIDELGYKGSVYDELVEQIDWKKHEEKVGMHNDKDMPEFCPVASWCQYVDDLLAQYIEDYEYISVDPTGRVFAPNYVGLKKKVRVTAVDGDEIKAEIKAINDDMFAKAAANAFTIEPAKATAAGLDPYTIETEVLVGYKGKPEKEGDADEPAYTFVNQFGQVVKVYEPIYETQTETYYGEHGADFKVTFTPENGGLQKGKLIYPLDYTRLYLADAKFDIEGVKKTCMLKGYNPALSWELSELNQEIEDTYPTADEEIRVYPFTAAGYDLEGKFSKAIPFAWTDNPNIKAFVQPAHVKDVVKEDITIKGSEFTDPWGNKVVVEDRVIKKGTEYWRPIKPEEELAEGVHSYELVVITKATEDKDVVKSHVWVKDNCKGSVLTLNIMPIRHRIYANTNPIHFPYNGGVETIGIDFEGFIGHTNSNYKGMLYDRENWNKLIGSSSKHSIFDINFSRPNESTEAHNSVVLNGRGSLEAEITCWPAIPGNYGVQEGTISIACDHETLDIPVTRTYPSMERVRYNDPTTPNVDESKDVVIGGENPENYQHEIEVAVKDMINCYDMKDDLEITVDNNQFEVTNSSRWFAADGKAIITINVNYIPCDPHEVVTAIVTVKIPGYNDKGDNVLYIPVKGVAGSAAVVAAVKGGNIDGISNVTVNGAAKTVYTISGARANNATKGIVIENGAKVAKK